MSRKNYLVLSLGLLALILTVPAYCFLPQFTIPSAGGAPQPDHWSFTAFPVQWNLNPNTQGAKIAGSHSVADAIQASFNTWVASPNTHITITRGADSSIGQEGNAPANVNLICFVCSDVSFGGTETLAITITTTANAAGQNDGHGGMTQFAGQITHADIAFNPAAQFDTSGSGANGEDLQTVATHEIGHFFGLDHSCIGRAIMYPFAPTVLTDLGYDDVAAISFLYPKSTPDVAAGQLSGKVTLNGNAVFGAHVFANSTSANNSYSGFPAVRKTPIGALTLPDGTYTISGVPPDSYQVFAEPLDLPVSNSDVNWDTDEGQPSVQTNFTTRSH